MAEEARKPTRYPLIPDKHYFTIGDVSKWCGEEQHVLRYWEQVFRQLKPDRRGGRRFYTKSDLLIIRQIYTLLRHEGYTIDAAKRIINSDERASKEQYNNRLLDEIINELQAILKSME